MRVYGVSVLTSVMAEFLGKVFTLGGSESQLRCQVAWQLARLHTHTEDSFSLELPVASFGTSALAFGVKFRSSAILTANDA